MQVSPVTSFVLSAHMSVNPSFRKTCNFFWMEEEWKKKRKEEENQKRRRKRGGRGRGRVGRGENGTTKKTKHHCNLFWVLIFCLHKKSTMVVESSCLFLLLILLPFAVEGFLSSSHTTKGLFDHVVPHPSPTSQHHQQQRQQQRQPQLSLLQNDITLQESLGLSFEQHLFNYLDRNDTTTPIIIEGYVTSKRSLGKKLMFADFQIPFFTTTNSTTVATVTTATTYPNHSEPMHGGETSPGGSGTGLLLDSIQSLQRTSKHISFLGFRSNRE